MKHLQKLIKVIKFNLENMVNDTSRNVVHNPGKFLTSDPQRPPTMCEEYQLECITKLHLEIHKNLGYALGHGQAALSFKLYLYFLKYKCFI